jgi:hypothetical protein
VKWVEWSEYRLVVGDRDERDLSVVGDRYISSLEVCLLTVSVSTSSMSWHLKSLTLSIIKTHSQQLFHQIEHY